MNELPTSLRELRNRIAQGETFEYRFFWKGPFSQWVTSNFTEDGVRFRTAEHYMMYRKALLFGDKKFAAEILRVSHPREAKDLGRSVRNFSEDKWVGHREEIVYQGSLLKFTQNPDKMEDLMATQGKILVEASPEDQIWGIGFEDNHPSALQPEKWKGLNLLGFTLTRLREHFLRESSLKV